MPDDGVTPGERPERQRRVRRSVRLTLGTAGIVLIGLYLVRHVAITLRLSFAGVRFGVFLDGVAGLRNDCNAPNCL